MNECNPYKEAKDIILSAWRDFRMEINDYLPDGDLKRYMTAKDAYTYYDYFGSDDISIIQKKFKAFGDLVSSTVMGDHCRGDIYRAYIPLEKAVKDNDLDSVLKAAWEMFIELRRVVIVLERLDFVNGRVKARI